MNDIDRIQFWGDMVAAVVFAVLAVVAFVGGCMGNRGQFVICAGCVLIVFLMVVEILELKRKNG